MRAYKILPVEMKVKDFDLSKDALKRLKWIDWYFSHGKNAEATCRHFSISKSVFYRWLPRFNKFNLSSLEFNTALRKPHHLRGMTTPRHVINLISQIRGDDLEKSKYEIQAELRDLHGVSIGYNTIQKIINRNPNLQNTFHKKRLKAHRKLKIARLRAAKELKERDLGSLVQIDTKYLYILTSRFYLFVAIDCKSRYAYVRAYKTISSSSAADFLKGSLIISHLKLRLLILIMAVNIYLISTSLQRSLISHITFPIHILLKKTPELKGLSKQLNMSSLIIRKIY